MAKSWSWADFRSGTLRKFVRIYNWKAGDTIQLLGKHRGFSPNRPLLKGYMTDNVPLNETGSGVLIDLGEDDDNNYEIVTITSSDDDDEDVVGDVCGIYKYPPGRFNHPFSGPGELAPGKVDNVELDINASHGAVSHRQPIHPSYQTVQARMMASSSQETEAEESCRSRAKPQCKVCLDGDVRVVFLPCGHLVTCVQCAPNFSLCPICRTEIKATVRAYFAE